MTTREEFERACAERCGVTVGQLHAWGRWAEPCDCDYPGCEGWAMGHQWEDAIVANAVRDSGERGRGGIPWT